MKTNRIVAYSLALAPLLTLALSYSLSIAVDHVPVCLPVLSGCTSSSSTGRAFVGRLVFLPGMLTTAILIVMFWHRCALRLAAVRWSAAIRWLGLFAGLSLAVYTVHVGQYYPESATTRRLAIVGYIFTHYCAQVLFLLAWSRSTLPRNGLLALTAICVVFPLAAIGGEIAKANGFGRHAVNNVIEWNSILLVSVFFILTGYYFFASRSSGRPTSPRE